MCVRVCVCQCVCFLHVDNQNLKLVCLTLIKDRFLLFQLYRNFANLFFKLSVSIFYKEISKFQQKV